MAHIIANRVAETSVTAGAGDLVLAPQPGYRRFSDCMAFGDTCWYVAEQFSAGVPIAWEIGRGTYKGGNTFGRTAVYESTNGIAPVAFDSSKKTITMAVVAPNATTATEWRSAMGLEEVITSLATTVAGVQASVLEFIAGGGSSGGGTAPAPPAPSPQSSSEDFTAGTAAMDESTTSMDDSAADMNAQTATLE